MKRWRTPASFLLFIALVASVAWWATQFLRPPARPVTAAPPVAQAVPPKIDAAASLLGGRGKAASGGSNFQLHGVVVAGNPADSVIILSAGGKPAQAFRASREIAPGVTVKEVHPRYVVLTENGVSRRVDLPEEAKTSGRIEAPLRAVVPPPRQMPSTTPTPTAPVASPAAPVVTGTTAGDGTTGGATGATSGATSAATSGAAAGPVVVTSPPSPSTPGAQATQSTQPGAAAQAPQNVAPGTAPATPAVPPPAGAVPPGTTASSPAGQPPAVPGVPQPVRP